MPGERGPTCEGRSMCGRRRKMVKQGVLIEALSERPEDAGLFRLGDLEIWTCPWCGRPLSNRLYIQHRMRFR